MASFSKKSLKYVITLLKGKFGSSNKNQIIIEGFRSVADIDKAGGNMYGQANVRIYGLKQADMDAATKLKGLNSVVFQNTIEIYAIEENVETLIFAGNIINAWADYQSIPDVFLQIHSQSAYYQRLRPVKPRSFKGVIDVATIMSQIAKDSDLVFENNGVVTTLTDIYLANSGIEQARDLAKQAGIDIYFDDNTLAIAPRGVPRKGNAVVISAETGMIGYPTFDVVGVNFQLLFNPGITFGSSIDVRSDLPQANGQWGVISLRHQLESENPGGLWFTTVRGVNPDYAFSK